VRFDDFWDADGDDENTRPLPPDGRNTGTITEVMTRTERWAQHERNPKGEVVRFKIDLGREHRPVWESIPAHWRDKIVGLSLSARVPVPQRGVDWDEKLLLGKAVVADLTRVVSERGTEYIRVERYIAQQALPAASRPAETEPTDPPPRRRNVRQSAGGSGSDDVPF
jgi:hypothetical protein